MITQRRRFVKVTYFTIFILDYVISNVFILLRLEQRSFSKGVNIKFGSEKDSKEFCDSFEEWRKDALVHGAS